MDMNTLDIAELLPLLPGQMCALDKTMTTAMFTLSSS